VKYAKVFRRLRCISKDIHACISAIDAEQKVKVISSKVINNTPKGFEILITWIEKKRKQKWEGFRSMRRYIWTGIK